MAYFNTCPYCHANLDPGEKCDCTMTAEREVKKSADSNHEYGRAEKRIGELLRAEPVGRRVLQRS